ncbi:MAG: ferritin [Candidatus Limnocylindria bacterium]
MISDKLRDFLVEQVGHELTAHQDYMGISLYFQQRSLLRWARLFRDQAIEEAQHATKVMDFLVDNEVQFDLPPLSGATSQFESALAAAQAALEWERSVTHRFRMASKLALDEGDATSHQFLQWFLAEQVEEEAKMLQLIDLIESGINLFQAEPLLDALDGGD